MSVGERYSGIGVVGRIPWGTHFGLFYHTKQDLIDVLVPYFVAGLENNELCVWVTADPLNADEAKACLAEALPDIDAHLDKGQIEVIPYSEWYTPGGVFDGERVLNGWIEKLRKAKERGFSGLRLTGNESWLDRSIWKNFIDYEQSLNDVVVQYDMLVVCSYDRDMCDANDILDVVGTHQFILSRRNGEWKVIEDQGQKNARRALRNSEEKYRSIVETASEGIVISDLSGKLTYVNQKMADMLGYDPGEMIGKTVFDFVDENDKAELKQRIERRKQGRHEIYEFKFIRKDGLPLWTLVSRAPLSDKNGKSVLILSMFTDITERNRAEEVLNASQWMLQLVMDNIPAAVFWKDRNSIYLGCNKVFARATGVGTPENIRGKTDYDLPWLREQADFFRECDRRIMENDRPEYHIIEQQQESNGKMAWVETNKVPLHDVNGSVIGILGMYEDITERKRAEEKLRDSEEKFRGIVETTHEGIWLLDGEGRVVFVNSRIAHMLGYPPEEMMGRYAHEFVDAHYVNIAKFVFDNRKRDLKGNTEIKFRRKDGSEMWARISSSPRFKGSAFDGVLEMLTDVTDDKHVALKMTWLASFPELSSEPIVEMDRYGNISYCNPVADKLFPNLRTAGPGHAYLAGIETVFAKLHKRGSIVEPREVWVGEDCYEQIFTYNAGTDNLRVYGRNITRRKRAEKELAQAKAQVELYLDLMCHDIGNMNQVSMGYLELALGSPDIDSKDKESLLKSMGALENSSRLIENVRKLQKVQTGELILKSVDVCQIILRVLGHYSNMPGVKANFNYELPPGCPVAANDLLYEVFENLVGNAIKHAGPGPTINVKFDTVEIDGKNYNKFAVEDDGPGIPDKLKTNVFDRMQRGDTKTKGSGLGLYLVKSLVDSYNGRAWVEDRVPGDHSKGARFVVLLPAVDK